MKGEVQEQEYFAAADMRFSYIHGRQAVGGLTDGTGEGAVRVVAV